MQENASLMCPARVERVSVPQMNSQCAGRCSGSGPAPGQFAPQTLASV